MKKMISAMLVALMITIAPAELVMAQEIPTESVVEEVPDAAETIDIDGDEAEASETETDVETETDPDVDAETVIESEATTDREIETVSESHSETETEAELETVVETATEVETETETEAETEVETEDEVGELELQASGTWYNLSWTVTTVNGRQRLTITGSGAVICSRPISSLMQPIQNIIQHRFHGVITVYPYRN